MANNVSDPRTGPGVGADPVTVYEWFMMTVEDKERYFALLNVERRVELCTAIHQRIGVDILDRGLADIPQNRNLLHRFLIENEEFRSIMRVLRSIRPWVLSRSVAYMSGHTVAHMSGLPQGLEPQQSPTSTDPSFQSKQQSSKHEKRQEAQEIAEKNAEIATGDRKRNRNDVTFDAKKLADELKCPICYDLPITVCTTTCGHNFCYLCISSSLFLKPECPSCRKRNMRHSLFMNKTVQWFVDQYAEQVLPEEVKVMRKKWYNEDKDEMVKNSR